MASAATSRTSPAARWWRTLAIAFWLGWKVESSWTDPFLFAVYSVVRPLGGLLILAVMVYVVATSQRSAMLAFLVAGSAFWPFVLNGMQGMAWGLISDREHWRTLRYIYTSPISFRAYLVGRALAQAASASAAAVVTLLFGRYVLGAEIHLAGVNALYMAIAFALGVVVIVTMGLLITGAAMSISGEAWRMPEAVGAALYLLCGAIFPVSVLPGPLQRIAQAIPLTWWLEAMRRGLLGPGGARSFPSVGDAQVLAILAAAAAASLALGALAFTHAERRARELGILDQESAY